MDYQVLREAIFANPACAEYIIDKGTPYVPDYYLKDSAIAEIFNAPTGTRLVERYENARGLMNALGAVTGAAILEKLDVAKAGIPALKWAMYSIVSEQGINLGDPETQGILDQLAAGGVLTAEEAGLVKGLAIAPSSLAHEVVGSPITAADVSIALRNF